jgi:hypothetical protein
MDKYMDKYKHINKYNYLCYYTNFTWQYVYKFFKDSKTHRKIFMYWIKN